MSFTSYSDLLTKITAGRINRYDWNKITGAAAFTAGRWYDFSSLGGTPIANAWAGTNLTWRTCDENSGNGTQIFGIPHGGNVSSDSKHILNAMAYSAVATAVPGVLMLMDLQGYWPGISTNSLSQQNLSGTPSLRYSNGQGCRLFFVSTTASGATAHDMTFSYTNQSATTGRTPPTTIRMVPSAIVGHVSHSGNTAFNHGPFLPMQEGDTGIANVASVTFSAASGAGAGALCLARPLLTIPIVTAAVATERDYVNQMTSFPRIMDGACLVWMYRAGAATAASTNFFGSLEFCWG
jgi:hypothetical protein